MFGFVTYDNFTFLERDDKIVDAATGELAEWGRHARCRRGPLAIIQKRPRQMCRIFCVCCFDCIGRTAAPSFRSSHYSPARWSNNGAGLPAAHEFWMSAKAQKRTNQAGLAMSVSFG